MTQPDVRREPDPAEQAWVQETDPSVKFSSTCKGPYMIGFDRGYLAGLAASPSEELVKLADELAHRVTVMEADHSLKYPLDILIRDSKVVSEAVNAYLTARAALRTTREETDG